MITISLLPRDRSRASASTFRVPAFLGHARFDRLFVLAVIPWIAAPALLARLEFAAQRRIAELQLDVDAAVADSSRNAERIRAAAGLRARRDTLASRIEMVHGLDAGRFVRAHMLDALRAGLPPRAWLTAIQEIADTAPGGPRIRVEGRAVDPFALTAYMKALEESPFLGGVRLIATSSVVDDAGVSHAFALEMRYEAPPPAALRATRLLLAGED